jgi:hypothetical protein
VDVGSVRQAAATRGECPSHVRGAKTGGGTKRISRRLHYQLSTSCINQRPWTMSVAVDNALHVDFLHLVVTFRWLRSD